jgi:predicted lipid-binding transport protein (Tim44 family)
MNEAADMGGNLPALILFWAWWVMLTVLNLMAEMSSRKDPGGRPDAAGGERATPLDPACREQTARADSSFDEEHFLQGALKAYEIVLEAYAAGNLAALRPLLGRDVLAAFESVIAGRIDRSETVDLTFIGVKDASIVDVEAAEGSIAVSVRFIAEIVSVKRSSDGTVLEGHPERTIETRDLWTFEPDAASSGGSWLVTATDGA